MTAMIEMAGAVIHTPGGRPLFEGLDLSIPAGRVALVGRNGVGKSLLLASLAGMHEPERGSITIRGRRHFVPQVLPEPECASGLHSPSNGERRKRALVEATLAEPDVLLLDEPTEDLDEAALVWLRRWLRTFAGCLIVASHDRRLLADFRHFFVASESGCRHFSGTLPELDEELALAHVAAERRYAHGLARLVAQEERTDHLTRRRARKKRYGRVSELDRCTPRIRLNQKRSAAQVYQGRFAKIREDRRQEVRDISRAARRALAVNLALELPAISLPPEQGETLVLRDVSASVSGRKLFESVNLRLGRCRIAIVGPNGSGKTTLLEVMLGRRLPSSGAAVRDLSKIGAIAQGGADWMLAETLIERLQVEAPARTTADAAQVVVTHRFPLALAQRPLSSLSPGERARAALLCLFYRRPAVELLVLDEPTNGLDLLGQRNLVQVLCAWPGGLVVTSHDSMFLDTVGFDDTIVLDSADAPAANASHGSGDFCWGRARRAPASGPCSRSVTGAAGNRAR